VLLIACPSAYPQQGNSGSAIEIINIQHRDADAIRQAIGPFLIDGGNISQIDNKIIISTSSANLEQLKNLIIRLDLPRRQLSVAVDFEFSELITANDSDNVIQTTRRSDFPRQTFQVLEGEKAWINRSIERPIIFPSITELGTALQQRETVIIENGIVISAELSPASSNIVIVTLETIAANMPQDDPDTVYRQVTRTVREIPLGQWISVSEPESVRELFPENSTVIASTTSINTILNLAVKIDLSPPN